jgi:hypothetical protein
MMVESIMGSRCSATSQLVRIRFEQRAGHAWPFFSANGTALDDAASHGNFMSARLQIDVCRAKYG